MQNCRGLILVQQIFTNRFAMNLFRRTKKQHSCADGSPDPSDSVVKCSAGRLGRAVLTQTNVKGLLTRYSRAFFCLACDF